MRSLSMNFQNETGISHREGICVPHRGFAELRHNTPLGKLLNYPRHTKFLESGNRVSESTRHQQIHLLGDAGFLLSIVEGIRTTK